MKTLSVYFLENGDLHQTKRDEKNGPGFRAIWTWFSANLLVVDDAYHIARVSQQQINKRRVRNKARMGAHFSWKMFIWVLIVFLGAFA